MFDPLIWQDKPTKNNEFHNLETSNNDVDKLIELIESTGSDITQGYYNWRNIAFALIDKFGASARNYFHRISKFHPSYNSKSCDKDFNGFLRSNGSGITIRSLFWIAKQNGIKIMHTNNNRNYNNPTLQESNFNEIKPVKFPVHVFPDSISEFVLKMAEAINCPAEYIAIPMLSCFAMAMSNRRVVELKKGWREYAILYAAIVGRPGTKKSPALNNAILPIKRLEDQYKAQSSQDKEKYQEECRKYDDEILKWKTLNKSERLNEEIPKKPIKPNPKQIMTNDITIEAIVDLLQKNNSGVLCHMDELSGWIKGMNQYKSGSGNDLEKWLSLWSAVSQIINRKGQDPIYTDNPFVNIVGGIQPDVLDVFIGKDNGLIDRILFSFPVEIAPLITDIEVPQELDDRLTIVFNRLYEVHFKNEFEHREPYVTIFSPSAYSKFKDYVNNKLYKEMTSDQMPYYLRGAWAKFPGYIARFALIIQGMNFGDNKKSLNEIDVDSLSKAIRIAEYFMENAKKVYAFLNSSKLDRKVELAERWINKNGGKAGLREMYSNKVAGCKNRSQAKTLLEEMVDRELGDLKEIPAKGGGRSTYIFFLDNSVCNPLTTHYNSN